MKKKTTTKQYDLHSHCKHELKHNDSTFLDSFQYAVARELLKTKITTELETRSHKFADGKADICKKLIITIDFNDAIVQPHSSFEDDFARACALELEQNINGLFENQ